MLSRVRWLIVWLFFLGGVINYMDRSALSVAAPLVAKDLRLDPAELGLVFSVFFFGYAIFCFVGGYLSDQIGPKRVYALSMAGWSVFCGLTAAAFSFGSLLLVRLLFGCGEGPLGATMNKMVCQWFPRHERASAIGMANAGTPLGGALAGPVVGLVALDFGWRASFVVIAAVGLIYTLLWIGLAKDNPGEHRWVGAAERAEIEADRPLLTTQVPLWHYLRRPAILATAFAFFGYAYLLYFFLSWFPTYLIMARHLSVRNMSFVTMIPWLLGFLGLALGGFLTDFIYRRSGRGVFARKLVLVTCLLLAAVCVAMAGLVETVQSAVVLMGASVLFLYLTGNTYWAIILDTVEAPRVGGVSGFVHLIANLAGIVSPAITGFLVQWTGNFTAAFVLAGAVAVIGALGVAVWVRAPTRSAQATQPVHALSSGVPEP